MDLVDTILDIDVELAELAVEATSITAQREELQRLVRGGQGALSRADAVEALQAQYEAARLGALEGLAATAAFFKQVSLINVGGGVGRGPLACAPPVGVGCPVSLCAFLLW